MEHLHSKTTSILDSPLDKGLLDVSFDPAEFQMASVSAQILLPNTPIPAELYLAVFNKETRKVEMRSCCEKGNLFQASWQDRLRKAEQGKLYVKFDQAKVFAEYYEQYSGAIVDNAPSLRRKREIIRDMAILNLKMFFGPDLSPKELEKVTNSTYRTVEQMAKEHSLLQGLSGVLRQDYSIYTHCVNVSMLSMAFGRYLNLSQGQIRALGIGGLLHDIGMSRLPQSILKKKGSLNNEEWKKMRQHPRLGYQMLLNVGTVTYDALMIILHHHENADGSGYPSGFSAKKTPLLPRVVKVVDAYDAITSPRPYHEAKPAYQAASDLMQTMSAHYGEDILPSFIRFLASPYMGH